MTDEWVWQKVLEIVPESALAGKFSERLAQRRAIAAFGQECITRTREVAERERLQSIPDEWVESQARRLHGTVTGHIVECDCLSCGVTRTIFTEVLHEAITLGETRTREAERALAAEALRAAKAKQEKAVEAERERALDAIVNAFENGRRDVLARLKNPDEELIEAASDAFYEALDASVAAKKAWNASMVERDLPYRKHEQSIASIEWLGPVIRALAATLDKEK